MNPFVRSSFAALAAFTLLSCVPNTAAESPAKVVLPLQNADFSSPRLPEGQNTKAGKAEGWSYEVRGGTPGLGVEFWKKERPPVLFWNSPQGSVSQSIDPTKYKISSAGEVIQLGYFYGGQGEGNFEQTSAILVNEQPVAIQKHGLNAPKGGAQTPGALNYTTRTEDVGKSVGVSFEFIRQDANFVQAVLKNISLSVVPANRASATAPVGQEFDFQKFVDDAVKTGQKRIVVPPGRYRVTPRNRQHLLLENLQDVEIVAEGVEFICTQTTRAITIANCRNLTLRGLTIDYDPLPFTQGRIVSISPDKSVHEIELFDGYPAAPTATKLKYEIFRPDTRTLRVETPSVKEVTALDARRLRVTKARSSADDAEQVGDLIVIASSDAPGGQIPHAIVTQQSADVRLENINLWASNSFGFFETGSDGTTYLRCRIDRRPLQQDLVQRADARLRSLHADAFHSNNAARGPQILECVAKFMGDDAVNIRGQYSVITENAGANLRVLVHGEALKVGEEVELWSYEGVRLPNAKVVRVEADGKINEAERAFLMKQRMDARLRTTWTPDAIRVTLDRAVELPLGSLIASTRRVGNGFLVKGCDFGFNRSRGILIKGSDGQVIDNTLTANWGAAILVTPEYWWLEAGSSNNVIISGNRIKDCLSVPIAVMAKAGNDNIAPSGAHSNIVIQNNQISGGPWPSIAVTSTENLRIDSNSYSPSDAPLTYWWKSMLGIGEEKVEAIYTKNSDGAAIQNNVLK